MQKDVVYIDVEDDITDVVSKVKVSKEAIVALIPPKRIGMLQSVVNLKLLARTAKTMKKRVVIISNNPALEPLAAVAQIPIAKTLQSRPEIPALAEEMKDDLRADAEVIDGEKISIGEFAGKKVVDEDEKARDEVIDKVSLEDDEPNKEKKKKAKKIPDFGKFRKKLIIAGAAAVMLIGVLVWAFVFAPSATVVVGTRTSNVDFEEVVTLVRNESEVDVDEGVLLMRRFELVKTEEVEFEATGSRYVGERATGTLTLERNMGGTAPIIVPVGAMFQTAAGQAFVTTSTATIPAAIPPAVGNEWTMPDPVVVNVQAIDIGDEYNIAATAFTPPVSGFTARGSAMSGGTRRAITVVTQEDFERARGMLMGVNEATAREELFESFRRSYLPIETSLSRDVRDPVVSPELGEEVEGRATLTAETVHVAYGVSRRQVEELITSRVEDEIEEMEGQRVYDLGMDRVFLTNCQIVSGRSSCRMRTVAEIGPDISEEYVRDAARGERFGEVQRRLEAIEGVREVDVEFSFFWVRVVPNNDARIHVRFEARE
ncbi:hypothetical protein FWD07_02430 [Candidatus Saccharibacteria bacterium]|nr:hypothetical protein [Candidatus Saccharibacteria bacterium]